MKNELTIADQSTAQKIYIYSPQTLEDGMKYSKLVASSNFVPKSYRGRPQDVLLAIHFGSYLGLYPLQALQNISVINGKPAIWGDLMLALCQAHKDFEDICEEFDEKSMTAKCIIKRRGRSECVRKFSIREAETAGLTNKRDTPWQTYPKRMLQMRARSFALRDSFADALYGLITVEEARDIPVPASQTTTDTYTHDEVQMSYSDDTLGFIDRIKNSSSIKDLEEAAGTAPPMEDHERRLAKLEYKIRLEQLKKEEAQDWNNDPNMGMPDWDKDEGQKIDDSIKSEDAA